MKLNDTTLTVLKNFATIQSNLVVNEGNVLRTIAEAKNIVGTAVLDQEFPQSFGVYDLPQFLCVLGLVDEPNLIFTPDYVTVTDSVGRSKVKYFFSSTEVLTAPTKDIKMPSSDVSFTLDEATLNKIRRASGALGYEKMSITPSEGSIVLSVVDNMNATSNSFAIEVPGNYTKSEFCFLVHIDNMKLIPGDYEVELSSKLISKFSNKTTKVEYFIALEKSSTFGV